MSAQAKLCNPPIVYSHLYGVLIHGPDYCQVTQDPEYVDKFVVNSSTAKLRLIAAQDFGNSYECPTKRLRSQRTMTPVEVCSKHSASRKVPVKSTRRVQKMWTERKTMADQQTQDPRGTLYLENPQKSDHGPPPEGCQAFSHICADRAELSLAGGGVNILGTKHTLLMARFLHWRSRSCCATSTALTVVFHCPTIRRKRSGKRERIC